MHAFNHEYNETKLKNPFDLTQNDKS